MHPAEDRTTWKQGKTLVRNEKTSVVGAESKEGKCG